MTALPTIKGITWNHTRGFLPMVATGQRFFEEHRGVEIVWEKRTLQEFADAPIDRLIEQYDLLVIDHPWAGFCAAHDVLLPLNDYLPIEYLADQRSNQVGLSYDSYSFGSIQNALPIDAATPVASWRADLIADAGGALPKTWDDVLALARKGKVIFPAIEIDSLIHFYMLCIALGEAPFLSPERVITTEVGVRALELLRALASLCSPEIFSMNPIAIYESLSSSDNHWYCPFGYGYSNYAREGYGKRLLSFGDLVTFEGKPLRSTLGGTGLAISARSRFRETAVEYARMVASRKCQRTLYTASGGQPGHRLAWLDAENNRLTHNYFVDTLPALDRSYLRPRYNGYLHFQDRGGKPVCEFMLAGGDATAALAQLNILYHESSQIEKVGKK